MRISNTQQVRNCRKAGIGVVERIWIVREAALLPSFERRRAAGVCHSTKVSRIVKEQRSAAGRSARQRI